jgi:hypothetical protein
MLWVDHESYFGPDRRRKHGGLRMRERRRYDYAANPPPVPTALRQLRMRVLDAAGAGVNGFAARAQGVAQLAEMQHEPDAADALRAMARKVTHWAGQDVRQSLYDDLDRAHASLRYA